MQCGLVETAAAATGAPPKRFYGVAVAQVVTNVDSTGQARVQVRLPWLPGFEPWARVAVPLAGGSTGTFVIPQVGDEVLVAFHHGDVREPYVVGSLWNGSDKPPKTSPNDPVTTFMVKTPNGHEVVLDDAKQEVTLKTTTGQEIKATPDAIELTTNGGTAKLKLATSGEVELQGSVSVTIKAPQITLDGAIVQVKASGSATIDGGGQCSVSAGVVRIN